MNSRLLWIALVLSFGLLATGCGDEVAKTNDNALATLTPTSTVAVTVGESANVTATFTTDDGNAASSLSISSTALSALPSGWSSNSDSLFCAAFADGNGCQLTLSYAPTGAGSGTVTLPYSYDDDAGQSKTGSLSIVYTSSTPTYAYVTDQRAGGSGVYLCTLGSSGALSGCAQTGENISDPASVVVDGSNVYVGDGNGDITLCSAAASGALSSCTPTSTPFAGNLASYGGWLYYPSPLAYGGPEVCAIGSGGALTDCASTNAVSSQQATGIAFYNDTAYVSTYEGLPGILLCAYGTNGSVSNCEDSGTSIQNVQGVVVSQNSLYVMQQASIDVCAIAVTGTLSACVSSAPFALSSGWVMTYQAGMAVSGGRAYLPYYASNFSAGGTLQSGVAICTVNSNGSLSGCVDSGIAFDQAASVTIP